MRSDNRFPLPSSNNTARHPPSTLGNTLPVPSDESLRPLVRNLEVRGSIIEKRQERARMYKDKRAERSRAPPGANVFADKNS